MPEDDILDQEAEGGISLSLVKLQGNPLAPAMHGVALQTSQDNDYGRDLDVLSHRDESEEEYAADESSLRDSVSYITSSYSQSETDSEMSTDSSHAIVGDVLSTAYAYTHTLEHTGYNPSSSSSSSSSEEELNSDASSELSYENGGNGIGGIVIESQQAIVNAQTLEIGTMPEHPNLPHLSLPPTSASVYQYTTSNTALMHPASLEYEEFPHIAVLPLELQLLPGNSSSSSLSSSDPEFDPHELEQEQTMNELPFSTQMSGAEVSTSSESVTLDVDSDDDLSLSETTNTSLEQEIWEVSELELNDLLDAELPSFDPVALGSVTVAGFLWQWRARAKEINSRYPKVNRLEYRHFLQPRIITREDLGKSPPIDMQGMDWAMIGVPRKLARQARQMLYRNYQNIEPTDGDTHRGYYGPIKAQESDTKFYQFRRMETILKARYMHFQLRNVMTPVSRNCVLFSRGSKIACVNPSVPFTENMKDYSYNLETADLLRQDSKVLDQLCVLDISNSPDWTGPPDAQRITTMQAGHGILIAGGFTGQYAMKSLYSNQDEPQIEGLLDSDIDNITNHIEITLDRQGGSPIATFSSNDSCIRILDCTTSAIVAEHKYNWAINCSATSPDGRLRVSVGDMRQPLICRTDTGTIEHELLKHNDYGFACDWSQNGWHVATGNQDSTVQIWDARNWSEPLKIIKSEMGSVRSLHFSPTGGGAPILAVVEAADFVSFVDTRTFESKQTVDFFGEVGGAGFTPDGDTFFVANSDGLVGGLMEFERAKIGDEDDPRLIRRRKTYLEPEDMNI
ncbi:MAG: hypothetical protein M1834_002795 [Cirrosporium novae-zelandiae]|nr:MAG: hypothetical protein M1834_002795 [Cirrosporium novae-zelandiae]